jgi:hypothetical protein
MKMRVSLCLGCIVAVFAAITTVGACSSSSDTSVGGDGGIDATNLFMDASSDVASPGSDSGSGSVCVFDDPASTFDGTCTFGN